KPRPDATVDLVLMLVALPPRATVFPYTTLFRSLVSGPVPKSTVPLNFPVTSTLPFPSTATARPVPPPSTPPRHFYHSAAPVGAYVDTKTAVGGHTTPPPKSTLLSIRPVITALPLPSNATP